MKTVLLSNSRRSTSTTKQPTWEQIAKDKDAECSYLLRRVLKAEGRDPDDPEALAALTAEAESSTQV